MPYERGTSLRLEVSQSCNHLPMPASALMCEAIVLEPLTMTMSAGMKLRIQYTDPSSAPPGGAFNAVLKLYDRRFGTSLQRRTNPITWKHEPHPHKTSTEAAYCDVVRRGHISPFLHDYYVQECRSELISAPAWHFVDDCSQNTRRQSGTSAGIFLTARPARMRSYRDCRGKSYRGSLHAYS